MTDKKMPERGEHFALARSTAHLAHRAHQVAADRFARRGHAVSLRQYGVLAAIAEKPGASQNELVRAASIDRSTLADMLKRMELHGLIARSASKSDARANCVELTDLGHIALAAGADDARKSDQAVLDALPKSKRKAFQEALLKLAQKLDALAEAAARKQSKQDKRDAKRAKLQANKERKAAKAK